MATEISKKEAAALSAAIAAYLAKPHIAKASADAELLKILEPLQEKIIELERKIDELSSSVNKLRQRVERIEKR